MAQAMLATPVLSDAGTVQAGSQSGGAPVTNLLSMQPGLPWRALDLGNAWFTVNLPAAPEIDFVALLAHTASAAATWRIRAADSEGDLTAAPAYDSTEVSMWPPGGRPSGYTHLPSVLSLIAAPVSRAWWRIDILDPGNPKPWVNVGRLYLSKLFRPGRNFAFGASGGWNDPSPRETSVGGQIYPEPRPQHREETVTFAWLSEEEMYDGIEEIRRQRGTSRDLLLIPNIDDTARLHQKMIYGLLSDPRLRVNRAFNLYEQVLKIEELIP